MLQQIDQKLEKWMNWMMPFCIILGIIFSAYFKDLTFLVPWLFAFMTFEGSLSMNFKSLKGAVNHPFPIFVVLGFLHIVMPLWAWIVGHITFNGDTLTITGLVLGMAIPTGVTSFIWVSMKKGNSALALAIILIDSLLSPFIVPFSLSLFINQKVSIDFMDMMVSLLYMIVLPSIVGMLLNEISKGKVPHVWKPRLSPFSKLFMGFIVVLNGAVIAPYLKEINIKLFLIILVVTGITITAFIFAFLLAKLLKYDRETLVAFTFTGGIRNISAGTVIAIAYFPPAVILPVVTGMLFQLALASIYASVLDRFYIQKMKKLGSVYKEAGRRGL